MNLSYLLHKSVSESREQKVNVKVKRDKRVSRKNSFYFICYKMLFRAPMWVNILLQPHSSQHCWLVHYCCLTSINPFKDYFVQGTPPLPLSKSRKPQPTLKTLNFSKIKKSLFIHSFFYTTNKSFLLFFKVGVNLVLP